MDRCWRIRTIASRNREIDEIDAKISPVGLVPPKLVSKWPWDLASWIGCFSWQLPDSSPYQSNMPQLEINADSTYDVMKLGLQSYTSTESPSFTGY
jgi:hypothetical protein